MKTKLKTKQPNNTKKTCVATALVMGKKYVAEGTNVLDALSKLEVRGAKGKCILSVNNGERNIERVLMPAQAFRLFNTAGITKEVTLKNIATLYA